MSSGDVVKGGSKAVVARLPGEEIGRVFAWGLPTVDWLATAVLNDCDSDGGLGYAAMAAFCS